MNPYTLFAFVIYLIIMVIIGLRFSKEAKSLDAYYLGGRKMNKWVVALSAQASDMSGWLLMGLPGAVYLSGFSEAWIGIGLGIGTYLNWKIVAKRLRLYSLHCGNSITIPDFLSNRFRDGSGIIRGISAMIILLFFTFYTASGFVACGKLFSSTFGIGYKTSLIIGVAVVLSYTLLGGFMAVCWTDVIQGLIMFLAISAIPLVAVLNKGGFSQSVESINSISPYLLNLFTAPAKDGAGTPMSLISLLTCFAWGLGYFGMPHILVRFMSIDDPERITASRRIAMTWVSISLAAAVAIGLLGRMFYPESTGFDKETIFIVLAKDFFPPIIVGIMLSAILAAIMSTADSQLLVAASAFSNDFYKKHIRKGASNKELIAVSRAALTAVALVGAAIVWNPNTDFCKEVMALVSFAWGGFGAAFGPIILLALFWKRTTLAGAAVGMIVGATTCIIWKFYLMANFADKIPLFKLYELAPAFILSMISIYIVSKATAEPSKEITDEFDTVKNS